VKGKKEPTRIYELLDEKINPDRRDFRWIAQYEQALQLYRAGDWENAITAFSALAEGKWHDKASATMLERCAYLLKNPPEEWDGILTLEIK
jgi:adenylate cyclase